jgi:hypothetical protein
MKWQAEMMIFSPPKKQYQRSPGMSMKFFSLPLSGIFSQLHAFSGREN